MLSRISYLEHTKYHHRKCIESDNIINLIMASYIHQASSRKDTKSSKAKK